MGAIERATIHEVINAVAILAKTTAEVPLAAIACGIAELTHDEELRLPVDAANACSTSARCFGGRAWFLEKRCEGFQSARRIAKAGDGRGNSIQGGCDTLGKAVHFVSDALGFGRATTWITATVSR
jgi:hypothetical protein